MFQFPLNYIQLEKIDSTQTYAKKKYLTFPEDQMTIISTLFQEKGYGRFNRNWIFEKNKSLAFTIFFKIKKEDIDINCINYVMNISLLETLTKFGVSPLIRWPNDILINGKKIAGCITEVIFQKDYVFVFLGVGININNEQNKIDLVDQKATSLFIETKKLSDNDVILKEITKNFLNNLHLFIEKGFNHFYKKYNSFLAYKNQEISFFDGNETHFGTLGGIEKDGRIEIITKDNIKKHFFSGDVSIKPFN